MTTDTSADQPLSPWVGRLSILGTAACMLPTAIAIMGGLFLVLVNLAAQDAVANDGQSGYLEAFTFVFSVVAALMGGVALSILGLMLHTIGLVLAGLGFYLRQRVLAVLFSLMHIVMLGVDVLYLTGFLTIIVVGGG